MKTIHTKHAPAAIGPYSQAKQAGGADLYFFPDKSVSTRLQEKSSPPTSPDKQSRSAKT